ncbi:MAG: hypothetical protein P8M25_19355 [Paracoccaceae bacterium]|nr:hypothetical protein [Paracoccaceae bacterium]
MLAKGSMSRADFDAYTAGKTLYFNHQGKAYGAERYLDGRRVEWSFLDGECTQGHWYEAGKNYLCFIYENVTIPQSWQFFKTASGLQAQFKSTSDVQESEPVYEVLNIEELLLCYGPGLAV